MRRRRRSVIFRQNCSWRWRFTTLAACTIAATACVTIGIHFGAFQTSNQIQWPHALALSSAIPAMIGIMALFLPRKTMRISDEYLQFARTYPYRKRTKLAWRDIRRLRLGATVIADDGKRRIWLTLPALSDETSRLLKSEVDRHLALRFDLSDPGLVEFRNAVRRTHWSPTVAAIVVAHAVALPLAIASPGPSAFAISASLATVTIVVVAWRNFCFRRSSWRYPRQ